MASVTF